MFHKNELRPIFTQAPVVLRTTSAWPDSELVTYAKNVKYVRHCSDKVDAVTRHNTRTLTLGLCFLSVGCVFSLIFL